MTDSEPTVERFGDPEDDPAVRQEVEDFEPSDPADPEEPETIAGDEDSRPGDPGEADVADVAEQEAVVDDEDDGYDRGE